MEQCWIDYKDWVVNPEPPAPTVKVGDRVRFRAGGDGIVTDVFNATHCAAVYWGHQDGQDRISAVRMEFLEVVPTDEPDLNVVS